MPFSSPVSTCSRSGWGRDPAASTGRPTTSSGRPDNRPARRRPRRPRSLPPGDRPGWPRCRPAARAARRRPASPFPDAERPDSLPVVSTAVTANQYSVPLSQPGHPVLPGGTGSSFASPHGPLADVATYTLKPRKSSGPSALQDTSDLAVGGLGDDVVGTGGGTLSSGTASQRRDGSDSLPDRSSLETGRSTSCRSSARSTSRPLGQQVRLARPRALPVGAAVEPVAGEVGGVDGVPGQVEPGVTGGRRQPGRHRRGRGVATLAGVTAGERTDSFPSVSTLTRRTPCRAPDRSTRSSPATAATSGGPTGRPRSPRGRRGSPPGRGVDTASQREDDARASSDGGQAAGHGRWRHVSGDHHGGARVVEWPPRRRGRAGRRPAHVTLPSGVAGLVNVTVPLAAWMPEATWTQERAGPALQDHRRDRGARDGSWRAPRSSSRAAPRVGASSDDCCGTTRRVRVGVCTAG